LTPADTGSVKDWFEYFALCRSSVLSNLKFVDAIMLLLMARLLTHSGLVPLALWISISNADFDSMNF
jgi:hypothetical protein